jgi:D-alanyl-D-alanine carboxypeptidase
LQAAPASTSPLPTAADPKILDARATQNTESAYSAPSPHPGAKADTGNPDASKTGTKTHNNGWIIQIGAFDDENEAKQHLLLAQNKAKSFLNSADPFTQRINSGEKVVYRARFAGLGKEQAQTACKYLKRLEVPCMMLRN